jgi:dihydrofolate reductase
MSKVIFNMSTSLDGYVRAANPAVEAPLGVGGERVHDWFFGNDPANQQFAGKMIESIGAVVSGRTTYDTSAWGADGPTGPRRLPTFVVTHKTPGASPANGVYTFIAGGVAEAVRAARVAAGGKDISIMGGPSVGGQDVELQRVSVIDTADAVHIVYRVVK